MPRIARQKTFESIYHVMCRSISEIDMYTDDDDKLKYIFYIKKYQRIYKFKIYSYCFMSNHVHLIIDTNGADISKIMHGINFSYAQYYNRIHKRHGHLFQDRFKSKIIKYNNYLITASAYIHNNPKHIAEYATCPEKYEYSSLPIYLGLKRDPHDLLDANFILRLFGDNPKSAIKAYYSFVLKCDNDSIYDIEFENEETFYVCQRKIIARSTIFKTIIEYVAKKTNTEKAILHTKNNKSATEARALLVLLMKSLCNYNSREICAYIGNITQTNVSRLIGIGLNLIKENPTYMNIFEEFINEV